MGTTTVEWGEPPAGRRRATGVDYRAVAATLAKRPGEWAKVWEGEQQTQAVAVRVGLMRLGCDATQRSLRVDGVRTIGVWAVVPAEDDSTP